MTELDQIRQYNAKLYDLNRAFAGYFGTALPRAIAYDSGGGARGQPSSQVENACVRADGVATAYIKCKTERDQLAHRVHQAAYKSDITDREWYAVKTYYIMTKRTGVPFKWAEVAGALCSMYGVGSRQAYNYRVSGCEKILQNIE